MARDEWQCLCVTPTEIIYFEPHVVQLSIHPSLAQISGIRYGDLTAKPGMNCAGSFRILPYGLTWPAAPTTLRGLVSSTGTRQN